MKKSSIGSAVADMGAVIRYETWEDGTLVALRERADGSRYYQVIHKAGNFTF